MYFAHVTCTRNRYIRPLLSTYQPDLPFMRHILAMQNCTYLFLWHFEFKFSRHEFHFPFKHSDPNPMHENKLKKCFFCITLKCSVNPRRAKEKYQIVKKKYILKMGQLKNKAFRNNRNVKDSKILQFQPGLVSTMYKCTS